MQKNTFYKNPERGRKTVPDPQAQCMGMAPDRPKTKKESFGQWVMDGNRCRLKARPFFCPVHLHQIKEQAGCCAVIDEEVVGRVLDGLPKDDPWREVGMDELLVRLHGVTDPEDIYNPTDEDRNTLCDGG